MGVVNYGCGARGMAMDKSKLIQRLLVRNASIEHPEQKLMMAVLCNAVADLMLKGYERTSAGQNARYLRNFARNFFTTGRYVEFCDWVSLDPDWVLEVLRDYAGLKID